MKTLCVWLLLPVMSALGQELAFPGAEGFGRHAKSAARHPDAEIRVVNNLRANGPGSFVHALRKTEHDPPIVVTFPGLEGTIVLPQRFLIGNTNERQRDVRRLIYLAGQTATGKGICIAGTVGIHGSHDVIVRNLRFRAGDDPATGTNWGAKDAFQFFQCQNCIADHVSASWGIDETLSVSGSKTKNVTIQNAIISEGLLYANHSKAVPRSMGSIIQGEGVTVWNCLWAHNNFRNPNISGKVQLVGNVTYGWWSHALGVSEQYFGTTELNWHDNVYLASPSTAGKGATPRPDGAIYARSSRIHELLWLSQNSEVYATSNYYDWEPDGEKNLVRIEDVSGHVEGMPRLGGKHIYPVYRNRKPPGFDLAKWNRETWRHGKIVDRPFDYPRLPIRGTSNDRGEGWKPTLWHVLDTAGAWPRDSVDARVVADVRNGTGQLINSQNDVGGFPRLETLGVIHQPPQDSDGDGIPDNWEVEHGRDPNAKDSLDAANREPYQYMSWLDWYLQELIDAKRG